MGWARKDGSPPDFPPARGPAVLASTSIEHRQNISPRVRSSRVSPVFDPDRIALADGPAVQYAGIDTHVGLRVPGGGLEDA